MFQTPKSFITTTIPIPLLLLLEASSRIRSSETHPRQLRVRRKVPITAGTGARVSATSERCIRSRGYAI